VATSTNYLLDTGIIIRELRGDARAAALLNRLAARGMLSASAITVFEIYQNCRSAAEEVATNELFDRIAPRELTFESARLAGSIMRSHGSVFSSERTAPDALIAASAIVDGAILVTLNVRQFARAPIPGLAALVIEQDADDWTSAVP